MLAILSWRPSTESKHSIQEAKGFLGEMGDSPYNSGGEDERDDTEQISND